MGGRGLNLRVVALGGLVMVTGCGSPQSPNPPITRQSPASEAPASEPPPQDIIQPPPSPPRQRANAPGDLAPCPGINPDIRRLAGSNCLGVLPAECGADKATAFVGRNADSRARGDVAAAVGHASIRWIAPGEPVIQDLQRSRLNILLDERGRIAKADCY
jgi:hypothetical protein